MLGFRVMVCLLLKSVLCSCYAWCVSYVFLLYSPWPCWIAEVEADVEGKIFLGGLTWQTTEDMLKTHFGKWGSLNDVILMRNKITGEPRGFGFVQFMETACEYRSWHPVFVFFCFFSITLSIWMLMAYPILSYIRGGFSGIHPRVYFWWFGSVLCVRFSIQYRCCGSVSLLCVFAREDDYQVPWYLWCHRRAFDYFFSRFFPAFFRVLVNSIRWS